jgi:hypothetical protein
MIVARCQRKVSQDSSPESIGKSLDEIYAFFTKFENVVNEDLRAIFS